MSSDFERVRDNDETDDDRADPEEPATWNADNPPSMIVEVDHADWADQQAPVDDSPFDEDSAP